MRPAKFISSVLSILCVCVLTPRIPAQTLGSRQRIVIAANEVFDCKAGFLSR